MALRLNGSTSGYVELDAPAVAGTTALTLPDTSGTVATQAYADTAGATLGGLVHIATETFSAAATVSLNNCFTSNYQNYRILMVGTSSTGMGSDIRLRASGTDSTGSHYVQQNITASGSGTPGAAGQTGTSFAAFIISNGNAMMLDASIFRPNEAVTTQINALSSRETYLAWSAGYHTQTTAYDGFSLIAAAGETITGTVRVYGYLNS